MALLSVPEAARRMGVSAHTIRSYIKQGRIKAQKIGRNSVIDEADTVGVEFSYQSGPRPSMNHRARVAQSIEESSPAIARRILKNIEAAQLTKAEHDEAAQIVASHYARCRAMGFETEATIESLYTEAVEEVVLRRGQPEEPELDTTHYLEARRYRVYEAPRD